MSMGLSIEEHDQEGRVITAEYPDFYGMCVLLHLLHSLLPKRAHLNLSVQYNSHL